VTGDARQIVPVGLSAACDSVESVRARRFVPIDKDGEAVEAAGWAAPDDPLDDDFVIDESTFAVGDLRCLAYREDRIVLPRPLLKSHAKKRLVELEESGEEVTKATRQAVEAAVASELRRTTRPKTRIVELVWDLERQEVRAFGRGPMVLERVVAIFERTFGLRLEPATYARRAFDIPLGTSDRSALESLLPADVFGGGAVNDLTRQLASARSPANVPIHEKEFLGSEFLTWLYFHLTSNAWALHVANGYDGDPIQFALGKRVALRRLDQTGARVVLSGSELDGGGELLQAIQRGALIDEMALGVAIGSRVYSVTLGADGGLSGVALPDLFTEPEEDGIDPDEPAEAPRTRRFDISEIVELRAFSFADVEDVLDELFASFLFRRLSPAMAEADADAMRATVARGLGGAKPANERGEQCTSLGSMNSPRNSTT